jgi:hypothetical protein
MNIGGTEPRAAATPDDASNGARSANGLLLPAYIDARGKRVLGPEDPNYFDPSFWPVPQQGQTWVEARYEQVAAIRARGGSVPVAPALPALIVPDRKRIVRPGDHWPNFKISSPREDFWKLLPPTPYCSNDLGHGIYVKPKLKALERKYIQFNPAHNYTWMLHDIDEKGAWSVHDEANLPVPNIVIINRANGHGHSAYLLANPVAKHEMARYEPLKYFAAIERGYRRRLCADRAYQGFIAKNPYHQHWAAEWRRVEPYTLEELEDYLFFSDMAPDPSLRDTMGAGRNVIIFDELRTEAYKKVRYFKRQGRSQAEFHKELVVVASDINRQFVTYRHEGKRTVNVGPLPTSEIRSIAKSVSRWTWRHFSEEGFHKSQSKRGIAGNKKRWGGHVAANTTKPWEALKMSRATYYRKKLHLLDKADKSLPA